MKKVTSWIKTTVVAAGLVGAMVGAQASILTATDSTFGSFNNSSGTRNFSLGAGSINDVNIAISFAKCDDPSIGATGTACIGTGFSFNREIVFSLTHNSTTVNLVNQDTYSGETPGAGRVTVTFDDEATTSVGGAFVLDGLFKPVDALSAFDGQDAFGVWTLNIQDTVGLDPLDYFTSTLTVTVPEPDSVALTGLALVGLAATRRRKPKQV